MNQDCWLEIDLYWFQGAADVVRVEQLFERLGPIWRREPQARKGLSLCVGWLQDPVLEWNGHLDAVIGNCQPPVYEPWTYRRLATLIAELKQVAMRHGLADFHVAMMMLAVPGMEMDECQGGFSGRTEETHHKAGYYIRGTFLHAHPEVYDPRFDQPFFGAPLHVPPGELVCLRNTPRFHEYFADKLVSLAGAIGLDALVMRDGFFTPAYVRGNRRSRYCNPADAQLWTDSIIDLLAGIKTARPGFLTIGYNSGISPIEEWRSHGFDLERVARSGHLDLWITQTWGSAWQDYWPQQSSGFTFQLANLLLQSAMLAETPCRHLFIIETFDAWEPWDSMHQYPSKVAWEILAYSHAALLHPDGRITRPGGCYLSWMNRGADLLPLESVSWLTHTMNYAACDLRRNPKPAGPCLVYHRAGLEYLLNHPEPYSRGEEIDDWAAMLLKFGLPILSITRSEWLCDIKADSFVFPTPARLDDHLSTWLLALLKAGTPVFFTGQAALLPELLRQELNVEIESQAITAELPDCARVSSTLACAIHTRGLVLNQRYRTLRESSAWTGHCFIHGGPVLARHMRWPCWLWETPEWGTPFELNVTQQSVQSVQTYVGIAAVWRYETAVPDSFKLEQPDWQRPLCCLMWRDSLGRTSILLANLETGITGNSQNCASASLQGITDGTMSADEKYPPGRIIAGPDQHRILLGAHKLALVHLNSPIETS